MNEDEPERSGFFNITQLAIAQMEKQSSGHLGAPGAGVVITTWARPGESADQTYDFVRRLSEMDTPFDAIALRSATVSCFGARSSGRWGISPIYN